MDSAGEFRRQWQTLWRERAAPAALICDGLLKRYGESHRAYHNATHIVACLGELERYAHSVGKHPEFVLCAAIFFHDAVYDPQRHDNEAASADVADLALQERAGADELATIRRLILATEHKRSPARDDEALIVDVDLTILGQSQQGFDGYERAIRREYSYVATDAFCKGRAAVLRQFLTRPHIFGTEYFFAQYESAARVNLARSISRLESGNLEAL